MPRALATLLLCALALTGAGTPARGAEPLTLDENVTSPLERAAFVAIPAVYSVRSTIRIRTVRTGAATRTINRDITVVGTGFGVAPGVVVVARHVLVPTNDVVLTELAADGVPGVRGLDPAAVTVTRRGPRVVLRHAVTGALAEELNVTGTAPAAIRATPLTPDTAPAIPDLALVGIEDADAPTLTLKDDLGQGTPVVVVGFGASSGDVPTLRPGTLAGLGAVSGDLDDNRLSPLLADVRPGDSGAPVIDAAGTVRGVVLRRAVGARPAVISNASNITALLRDTSLSLPGESPATRGFAQGMRAFWRHDYSEASRLLGAVGQTYRSADLARYEAARANRLASSAYVLSGPSGWQRTVVSVGALAALLAAVLAAVRLSRGRDERRAADR